VLGPGHRAGNLLVSHIYVDHSANIVPYVSETKENNIDLVHSNVRSFYIFLNLIYWTLDRMLLRRFREILAF
jgi:hypothetical protein